MNAIKQVLNNYFSTWNEGFETKSGDKIREYMSEDFVGYWSHSGIQEPEPYYYDYDLDTVLKQMDNAEKTFEPVSVNERKDGDEYVILGKETNTINGKPFTAQCMFVWRNEVGGWKLLKEYIELEK
ncbi:nuclear transport factor 2 family protein [Halobacillus yeomjeoni]|uniref:DUF4440 domain-containing protein n=1 Tax=Halobacillus yeomjeoni TaxID=311194 RepID=UPI001CD57255|nr:DUF4440 domain-containing protein [Halobacillus yeomjeoni]MCA0983238.1 nuclear transport factor 2 family protein [Halobacillus yeomjeoni]